METVLPPSPAKVFCWRICIFLSEICRCRFWLLNVQYSIFWLLLCICMKRSSPLECPPLTHPTITVIRSHKNKFWGDLLACAWLLLRIHLFVVFFHFCANEDSCTAAGLLWLPGYNRGASVYMQTYNYTHVWYDCLRFCQNSFRKPSTQLKQHGRIQSQGLIPDLSRFMRANAGPQILFCGTMTGDKSS